MTTTSTRIFVIEFDRIGRNHDVPALHTEAADGEAIANAVYDHARPHLASREIEVFVNLDEKRGHILVGGMRPGGNFTIRDATP